MASRKLKTITIRLPVALVRRLSEQKQATGVSIQRIVENSLNTYLNTTLKP